MEPSLDKINVQSDEYPQANNRRILKALKLIRKAYTKQTELEKFKVIVSVPPPPSLLPFKNVSKTIPYSQPDPYRIKSLSDIQSEAKINYRLGLEKIRREERVSKVGIPRKIYVNLVSKIKDEVIQAKNEMKTLSQRSWKKNNNNNHENIILRKPQTARSGKRESVQHFDDYNGDPGLLQKSYSESSALSLLHPPPLLPSSSSSLRPSMPFQYGSNFSSPRLFSPSSPRMINITTSTITPRENKDKSGNNHISSASQSPTGKTRYQINREWIEMEERDAMNRLSNKYLQEQQRVENEKYQQRLRKWLIAVKFLSNLNRLHNHRLQYEYELEVRSNPRISLRPKAMAIVQEWLARQRIKLAAKRYPKYIMIIRGVIQRFWFRIKAKKRNKAIEILKTFLMDCKIRQQYFKKIYDYRAKLLKVQHYIRNWIAIQRARIELLFLAKEKIDRKRIEYARIERMRDQREAIAATFNYIGFSKTMNDLRIVKKKFHDLLIQEERYMNHIHQQIQLEENEKQTMMRDILDVEAQYKRTTTTTSFGTRSSYQDNVRPAVISVKNDITSPRYMLPTTFSPRYIMIDTNNSNNINNLTSLNHETNKSNDVSNNIVIKQNLKKPIKGYPNSFKKGQNYRGGNYSYYHNNFMGNEYYTNHWYERAIRHSETRQKIETYRKILIVQRRRHIINSQMQEKDIKYKMRKVDIKALREFLKDPNDTHRDISSNAHKIVVANEDTAQLVLRWNKRIRNVFLLLTQGGYDALQKL